MDLHIGAGSDVPSLSTSASSSTPPSSSRALSSLSRMLHATNKASSQTSTSPITSEPPVSDWRFEGPSTSQALGYTNESKLRCLDINETRTHAVLGGFKTLRTIRLEEDPLGCVEGVNIARAVQNFNWNTASQVNEQVRHVGMGAAAPYDIATARSDFFDIEDVAWSSGHYQHKIAAAARTGKILLLDLTQPGMYMTSKFQHIRQVHSLKFSPFDGSSLLSGSQDETVKLWDIRVQRSTLVLKGRSGAVRDVQWSPTDSVMLAFCTDSGVVQRWDRRYPRDPVLRISAHDKTCGSISWHHDGRHLASAGSDKTVKIWDMSRTQPGGRQAGAVFTMRAPHAIASIAWRPACHTRGEEMRHSTQFVTSYRDKNFLHVWDARRPFVPFREAVHRVNKSTTDMLWRSIDLLWTVGPEGDFEQHDIPFTTRPVERRPVQPFAWSPLGTLALVSDAPTRRRRFHNRQAMYLEATSQARLDHRRPSNSTVGGLRGEQERQLEYGRTPEDDGLDDQFLKMSSKQHATSPGGAIAAHGRDESLADSRYPKTSEDLSRIRTEPFVTTLALYKSFAPDQMIRFAALGGQDDFAFLAKAYASSYPPNHSFDDDSPDLAESARSCSANAELASVAGRYHEVRTWQVMGIFMSKLAQDADACKQATKQAMRDAQAEYYTQDEITRDERRPTTDVVGTDLSGDHDQRQDEAFHIAGVTASEMFCKLFHHHVQSSDFQMATSLYIILAGPLRLRTKHDGLLEQGECHRHECFAVRSGNNDPNATSPSFEMIEGLMSLYHEQLLNSQEYAAAADLRKVCFPSYHAAYDDTLRNNSAGARCAECRSPVNNPATRLVCETCHARAIGCSFCDGKVSPFALPGEISDENVDKIAELQTAAHATDDAEGLWKGGTRLWTVCWYCGHALHAACALEMWAHGSELCAAYGCHCPCSTGREPDDGAAVQISVPDKEIAMPVPDDPANEHDKAPPKPRGGKRVRLVSPGRRDGPEQAL